MRIKCWSPTYETEDDAREYDKAESMRMAVEAFATWSYNEEPFDGTIEVCARDLESGDLYSFEVEAEMVLQFDIGVGSKVDEREHDGEPEATDVA